MLRVVKKSTNLIAKEGYLGLCVTSSGASRCHWLGHKGGGVQAANPNRREILSFC